MPSFFGWRLAMRNKLMERGICDMALGQARGRRQQARPLSHNSTPIRPLPSSETRDHTLVTWPPWRQASVQLHPELDVGGLRIMLFKSCDKLMEDNVYA
ncbi:hypothetical protein F0562_030729 [Nyssa sinensis]|uniref:Uncharacterized protein n=1 Tax=Nyssa sinensis TaxID=561372 RepID=A0A5J5AZG0_9ASTE|nr:hypothetical protein F0562_030729 [Nyssa sinensis]